MYQQNKTKKIQKRRETRAQRRPGGKEKYSNNGVRVRLANFVAVKQQMDCSFSDSSHRWFSRWILLGSYSLGGNISCWFWQAGQLQQRQYPCFAFPCTCPALPQTGSAGTVLSATALASLCTPYVPHSSRFSLSVLGRKKFAMSGLTASFLPPSQVTSAVPWETKISTDCDDFYP